MVIYYLAQNTNSLLKNSGKEWTIVCVSAKGELYTEVHFFFLSCNTEKQSCKINYFFILCKEILINLSTIPNIDKEKPNLFIPPVPGPGSLSTWTFITGKSNPCLLYWLMFVYPQGSVQVSSVARNLSLLSQSGLVTSLIYFVFIYLCIHYFNRCWSSMNYLPYIFSMIIVNKTCKVLDLMKFLF